MEQLVEFDRDSLEAALKGGLDINDCERGDIDSLLLDAEKRIERELDEDEATLNLSAIGGEYKIGPISIKCVLGNLVLLNTINSPLMSTALETGDEIEFEDVAKALYVLAKGKEAIEPIMEISQRISDLLMLKSIVNENPALIDRLLDRTEKISKARIKFAQDAIDFYTENFTGYQFQEVFDSMMIALIDIGKSAENFPIDNTNGQGVGKKKV